MHQRPAIELYVGLQANNIHGEVDDLDGPRMFTAAIAPGKHPANQILKNAKYANYLLDSGAFSDKPSKRLTPELALQRQLNWEQKVGYNSAGIVSYDLLIDETWVAGKERVKQRWNIKQAEIALTQTIAAAQYLSSQREVLQPRTLILSVQGVDAIQYVECTKAVLSYARPGDWLGLGGWCILGRQQSLLPEYWRTIYQVLPLVRQAGLTHVHIFGVMFLPALGGLLWLADREGLTVSTDSTKPIKDTLWKTPEQRKQAGCRAASHYWKDNVIWWKEMLANLRNTEYYKQPPAILPARQLDLFSFEGVA